MTVLECSFLCSAHLELFFNWNTPTGKSKSTILKTTIDPKWEEEGMKLGTSTSEVHLFRFKTIPCKRKYHPPASRPFHISLRGTPATHHQVTDSQELTLRGRYWTPEIFQLFPLLSAFPYWPTPGFSLYIAYKNFSDTQVPQGLHRQINTMLWFRLPILHLHFRYLNTQLLRVLLTSDENWNLQLWEKSLPNRTQLHVHILGFLYLYF